MNSIPGHWDLKRGTGSVTAVDEIERLNRALSMPMAGSSDFDLNPDVVLPQNRVLRPAAVLIALQESERGLQVFLTKRASHLKHHPGQISFPGGKVDQGDEGVVQAALREAWEEIALPSERVDWMLLVA